MALIWTIYIYSIFQIHSSGCRDIALKILCAARSYGSSPDSDIISAVEKINAGASSLYTKTATNVNSK